MSFISAPSEKWWNKLSKPEKKEACLSVCITTNLTKAKWNELTRYQRGRLRSHYRRIKELEV